jgi:uracil-DNA glycosylase
LIDQTPSAAYDRLWSEINPCEKCKFDRRIDERIRERWRKEPFLPFQGVGPEPAGLPVRYLLVGMEPSARPKAKKTREYMQRKIANGTRNFKGDAHIRWAAHNWLVKKGAEAFVMTDLAKCMLPTKDAERTAPRRYANCWPWLGREIALYADTLRAIIPMGDEPHRWLLAFAQESWPMITKPIVHPAMRFKRWKDEEANDAGLPSDEEFHEFARWCDPKAKAHLDKRTRGLLARWQAQFAAIRVALDAAT